MCDSFVILLITCYGPSWHDNVVTWDVRIRYHGADISNELRSRSLESWGRKGNTIIVLFWYPSYHHTIHHACARLFFDNAKNSWEFFFVSVCFWHLCVIYWFFCYTHTHTQISFMHSFMMSIVNNPIFRLLLLL